MVWSFCWFCSTSQLGRALDSDALLTPGRQNQFSLARRVCDNPGLLSHGHVVPGALQSSLNNQDNGILVEKVRSFASALRCSF